MDLKNVLEELEELRKAGKLDFETRVVDSPYGDKPPPGFNDTLEQIGTVGELRRKGRSLNIFLPDTRIDVDERIYPYRWDI